AARLLTPIGNVHASNGELATVDEVAERIATHVLVQTDVIDAGIVGLLDRFVAEYATLSERTLECLRIEDVHTVSCSALDFSASSALARHSRSVNAGGCGIRLSVLESAPLIRELVSLCLGGSAAVANDRA
ncbi:hypothetical protein PENTCL1PPCAC_16260, partial [Pristionchus entomophagus]